MRKINLLACLAIVLLGSTLLSAQASRTWVSGVGDDANPCSRTAPCKTFAGAISKTAVGGEIDALDPGGFGALTITKAITLDGGGGQVASVLVAGTNGIVVAAPANAVVIIRNLRINGISGSGNGGLTGIVFQSGLDLNVENCVIFGFNNNGIDISMNQGTAASAHIINTIIKNVGGVGIHATNAVSPAVRVGITNSQIVPLGTNATTNIGIEAAQHSKVSVSNTFVENAAADGMKVDDPASGDAQLSVINSVSDFNTNGITADTGGAAVVGGVVGLANSSCFFKQNSTGSFFAYNQTNQNPGNGNCGTVTGIPRIP